MTGGGTAGHIYPALALANRLKSDGHEVLFIGTERGLESQLVPEAGFAFKSVRATGFDRSKPWTLISSGLEILISSRRAKELLRNFSTDRVIGFGGYVSIPVGLAAKKLNIPLVIHEQNSVPGLSNKELSKSARLVMASYESSVSYFPAGVQHKIVVTGNPVRSEILESDRQKVRNRLGLKEDDLLLVLFGGSRGARKLNTEFIKRVPNLLLSDKRLHIIQSTGDLLFSETRTQIIEQGIDACFEGELTFGKGQRFHVRPYIPELGAILSAADIAICRAGATTLAELSVLGVPSLLVPYPFASDDHQTKNAEHFVNAGAALMLSDLKVQDNEFMELISKLVNKDNLRADLRNNMLNLAHPEAVSEMADSIYSIR